MIASAARRPWYLPMCVSNALPVHVADCVEPVDSRHAQVSPTATCPPAFRPTVSSPMSSVVGRRPNAASTSSASSVAPSSSSTRTVPFRETRAADAPSRISTPAVTKPCENLLGRERLLALDQPLAPMDERHRASRAPTRPVPSRPRRRRRRGWRAVRARLRGRRLDVRPRPRRRASPGFGARAQSTRSPRRLRVVPASTSSPRARAARRRAVRGRARA